MDFPDTYLAAHVYARQPHPLILLVPFHLLYRYYLLDDWVFIARILRLLVLEFIVFVAVDADELPIRFRVEKRLGKLIPVHHFL